MYSSSSLNLTSEIVVFRFSSLELLSFLLKMLFFVVVVFVVVVVVVVVVVIVVVVVVYLLRNTLGSTCRSGFPLTRTEIIRSIGSRH